MDTTAKTGEVVLVPSYLWLQQANVYGVDKTTMIWYAQKMSAPDAEMSEVEFMSEKKKVPNAYIVPIPAGGKAKKGDIVLTWWQSRFGNGARHRHRRCQPVRADGALSRY